MLAVFMLPIRFNASTISHPGDLRFWMQTCGSINTTRFQNAFNMAVHKGLGEQDATIVVPLLAERFSSFRTAGRTLIIDVGANEGQTSRLMLDELTRSCQGKDCFAVIAFEPSEKLFAGLKRRSESSDNWSSWVGLQAVVGDRSGLVEFFSDGDQQGSLDTQAAEYSGSEKVPMVTLDDMLLHGREMLKLQPDVIGNRDLFEQNIVRPSSPSIFLLKIDAEGYDHSVMAGASRVLEKKYARFLVFEYNNKWFTQGRLINLKGVVESLRHVGYICFWIGHSNFIPVTGLYWSESYEIKTWSYLFCGLTNDKLLQDIVESRNNNDTDVETIAWDCFK
jgi:FkbM family methyltransferase